MQPPDNISYRLSDLKMRLEQVNHSSTLQDHETLLKFYVDIVPKIMDAERCSIFINEPGTEKIWLMCGTGVKEKEITPLKEGTVVGSTIMSGKWIIENHIKKSPYRLELEEKTQFITRNLLCAPIRSITAQGIAGAVEVMNKRGEEGFTPHDGELLQQIADNLSMALENILLNQEIVKVSSWLNRDIDRVLRDDIEFVAKSRTMQGIVNTVRSVSKSPVNVLIHGESGTGKELIARMIHMSSDRRDKPFISVNCASIPENLMESEFFGYEKGAFTGAVSSHKGRFEEADGGIIFMDEIREMPMVIQPKFLRVIQEGEGCRLGSNTTLSYNFRIISATNKDLRKEVADGLFRQDLFYRIFSVDIYIPPLRERREDIVPLAMSFMNSVSRRFRKKIAGYDPPVLKFFEEYCWPGNVRQMLHEVERLIALTPEGEKVTLMHCSQELQEWRDTRTVTHLRNEPALTLHEKVKELEVRCIHDTLLKTGGNKLQSSRLLGITRPGLDKKMKRYGIKLPK